MASRGFPYLAVANLKYKSPHKQDLTFSKGEKIRVISLAPKTEDPDDDDDDDDEWFIGESLDGSRKGTFPGGFVTISQDQEEEQEQVATSKDAAVAAPITSEVIKDADEKQEVEEEKEEGLKNKVDGATAPPTTTTDSQQVTEEKTGFGAPLPARPQSDDEDEEVAEDEIVEEKKEAAVVAPQTSEVEKEKPIQSQATPITTSTPSAPPSRSTTLSPPPTQSSTSSSPTTTTSKPVAPSKPNSLKDRIAAFNKPAESGGGAPPPLPKSKPGGWKRPAPAPGAPKPLLPGAKPTVTSPPPISSTTSTGQPPITTESSKVLTEETASKKEEGVTSSGSGFSAADAKSSIKMSLKERMAALQRGDSPVDDSNEAKSPPVPAPGKISQEKRNVALGGMGLATGEAGLSRKLSNASKEEGDEVTATDASTGKDLESSETTGDNISSSSPSVQKESSGLEEEEEGTEQVGELSPSQEETQDQPELTEEEQESARRAAIAERLAKLGGRRMGGGPSMFGGPPPPVKPKPKASMDTVASTESSTSIDSPAAATVAGEGEGGIEEAVSKPQTLAVPRRAAPPRRKKSSATPPPVASSQASESVTSQGEAGIEQSSEEAGSGSVEESTPVTAEDLVKEESPPREAVEETEPTGQEVEDVEEANVEPSLSAAEVEPEADFEEEEVKPQAQSLNEESEVTSPLDQEDEAEENEEPEEVEAPAAIPPRPTSIPPRPPSTGSIQTPSRPGSVRPPIPKSSLPPPPAETKEEEEEGDEGEEETSASDAIPRPTSIASPPPRRQLPTPTPPAGRPPIPKSPPPLSPGVGEENEEGDGNAGHGRQPSLGAVLAAPKPRHAVPTDDFEDDAEDASQVQPSSSATQELDQTVQEPAAGQSESQESEQQQQAEENEPELTEEEQEAERKAAITRRMAALSRGQMMPGMPGLNAFGAPMPIRKKTAPPVQAEESQDQVEAEETSNRISSPPLPRSPPPSIPTDNRRGSIQSISSIASPPPLPPGRRSTQISEDNRPVVESGEDSLSRRASFRPPIPKSREPSTVSALGIAQEEEEEEETGAAQVESRERDAIDDDDQAYATAIANQFTPSEEIQPPTLPTSPPPRAPPSAPSSSLPSRPSVDRSLPPTPQVTQQSSNVNPEQAESHLSTPSATQVQAATGSNFSQKSNSSRDLDLMPSSQWWRKGLNPLRLPPTIAGRPDCILYVDQASQTKRGRTKHTAEIHVLFEDYSQSVVELSFEDDDAEENATVLNQRHYFPPSKPTGEQLSKWSSTIGSAIAKAASSSTGKHATVIGDGSSRSFIATLLSQVKLALPPINQTYGSVILVQVGATVMEKSSDEIKAGDIVACFNSDFKGKKGLTPYHLVLGSQLEPTLAIVVEVETKKNKLKCVLQNANKGPEEVSLRLDDLKSGVLKVFRAVPNQGYLEDW